MGDIGDDGVPASIAAAWGVRGRAGYGPRPGLSLELIVDTAVRLAAAEGLNAVSMIRLGKELGTSAMALYRYVAAKDELLDLMLDAGMGAPPPPPGAPPAPPGAVPSAPGAPPTTPGALPVAPDAPPATPPVVPTAPGAPPTTHGVPPPAIGAAGWRAGLEQWAQALLAAMLANPWMLQVPVAAPPITPNQIRWLERCLGALAGTGLAEREKLSIVMLLSGYVRSWAATAAAGMRPPGDRKPIDYGRALTRLTDPEHFPAIAAAIAAGAIDHDAEYDAAAEFAFGLNRVLDGVAALVDGA